MPYAKRAEGEARLPSNAAQSTTQHVGWPRRRCCRHAYIDRPHSSMDRQQSPRTALYATPEHEQAPPDWAGSLTLGAMLAISAAGYVREQRDGPKRRLPVHRQPAPQLWHGFGRFPGLGGRQVSGRHDVRHVAAEHTADESQQGTAGAAKVPQMTVRCAAQRDIAQLVQRTARCPRGGLLTTTGR